MFPHIPVDRNLMLLCFGSAVRFDRLGNMTVATGFPWGQWFDLPMRRDASMCLVHYKLEVALAVIQCSP